MALFNDLSVLPAWNRQDESAVAMDKFAHGLKTGEELGQMDITRKKFELDKTREQAQTTLLGVQTDVARLGVEHAADQALDDKAFAEWTQLPEWGTLQGSRDIKTPEFKNVETFKKAQDYKVDQTAALARKRLDSFQLFNDVNLKTFEAINGRQPSFLERQQIGLGTYQELTGGESFGANAREIMSESSRADLLGKSIASKEFATEEAAKAKVDAAAISAAARSRDQSEKLRGARVKARSDKATALARIYKDSPIDGVIPTNPKHAKLMADLISKEVDEALPLLKKGSSMAEDDSSGGTDFESFNNWKAGRK